MLRTISSQIRGGLSRTFSTDPTPSGIGYIPRYPNVEVITDSSDPRCDEIYRLRGRVMRNVPDRYVFGDQVRGDLDEAESTTHYAYRHPKTGLLVTAIRAVNGVKSQLEMERYGWFNLSEEIKRDGVYEWCRLVADKSVRGTNTAPILYIDSVLHQRSLGNYNCVFMVDQKAKKLMRYYKRLTVCEEISNGPVSCDEFELGRKSHVMWMPTGPPGTVERMKFDCGALYPGIYGIIPFMKNV